MSGVTHPRFAPGRARTGGTWWSKAFLRAVEEAAFSSAELKRGRAHARGGDVGAITIESGSFVAAVFDRDDAFTVTGSVPVLAEADQSVLVELIAAEAGRIGALMSGELPHPFVEAVEEAGVELLPYGGELGSACTCDALAGSLPARAGRPHPARVADPARSVRALPAARAAARRGAGAAARTQPRRRRS
ncbi:hypothetical protein [Nocardioides sp. B-3]|uniref:hypothetical protein n=1 Tax=Nocardioides sp. B-3 TaxID=2895565 RepID=UPI0021539005|nr:hypothetical protein [Nocardioides sp. B-3]UUZ61024.1 hypothetical protein LP418_10320 [Nocardioides sp. B-3]